MEGGIDKGNPSEQVRIPHKFCPYCGAKNEPRVDNCANCGKDISWIEIPEPVPTLETPPYKPEPLPPQREPLSRRALAIALSIVVVILAVLLVVLLLT
ncbi:MAG: zinc ribbon domain-containing protein [Actinomycetota bacterium]|nr:zinc ribbon domain-containing protein [Actinomycetota bacterium]